MSELDSIEDLPILFEDELILVVNKPSGMLSQPGKIQSDSVLTRVLDHRRDIHGPALVHRLDMDTSGILLLAKTRSAHRALQQQFEHRVVSKRYRALLHNRPSGLGGIVRLPLRLDPQDRPRQVVCFDNGKTSMTLWHRVPAKGSCAVLLFPLTGRTHQLRVHMSSAEGMGSPIVGDRLYGHNDQSGSAERLMLHAEFLSFEHPGTSVRQCVDCKTPFSDC